MVALHSTFGDTTSMPLHDFVALYVRLRHPHHYDPSSWPVGLWIAFLWTLVPALLIPRGAARNMIIFIVVMLIVALIGAGIWFVSETLIQLSLYRFSIFVQLLGCAGAALWIEGMLNHKRMLASLGTFAGVTIIVVCAMRGPYFGAFSPQNDARGYDELCHWVSKNTPVDATVLVPPNEQSMRLVGQRAIVVNYKAVPQLSGQLLDWRQRMCDVLELADLNDLPREYGQTLAAIGARYDRRSDDHLISIARKFDARYIVVAHPLKIPNLSPVFVDASGKWMLYDLGRGG
jgi:hypothetical protein